MCNYLIKTVKSTQNQAKVCQHPARGSETADGVCQEREIERKVKRMRLRQRRANGAAPLRSFSRRRLWCKLGVQTDTEREGERKRERERDADIVAERTLVRESETATRYVAEAANLMRNENKLKSNFRITSSLAFQCKFKRQQKGAHRQRKRDREC